MASTVALALRGFGRGIVAFGMKDDRRAFDGLALVKHSVAFQAFCTDWQPPPPTPGFRTTPFSPGQVGMLIGAVVANHNPSGSDQPLLYWKPEHQPRISPMPMTFEVPSVISAKRAA